MPVLNCIIHNIDKKPDGNPSVLSARDSALDPSDAVDNLVSDINEAYNAKQNKGWGFFHETSGAYPFSGWLKEFVEKSTDFTTFTRQATEQLQKLLEESNFSIGGDVLFAHYQQGMTDYLVIAMLHHREGVEILESLDVVNARYLDTSSFNLAARINLSEWLNNAKSKQYISFTKGKGGRKSFDSFRDFIGCQEGIDSSSETRTLLKAFSDFVESEDLPEKEAREKTDTLANYAVSQAKMGGSISLEALSALIDEERPKAFFDHIRNLDYGLSPEIPPDKRILNKFRRFTGRAEGLSISFDSHLLGSKIEYNKDRDELVIHNVPTQLKDQLDKSKS